MKFSRKVLLVKNKEFFAAKNKKQYKSATAFFEMLKKWTGLNLDGNQALIEIMQILTGY